MKLQSSEKCVLKFGFCCDVWPQLNQQALSREAQRSMSGLRPEAGCTSAETRCGWRTPAFSSSRSRRSRGTRPRVRRGPTPRTRAAASPASLRPTSARVWRRARRGPRVAASRGHGAAPRVSWRRGRGGGWRLRGGARSRCLSPAPSPCCRQCCRVSLELETKVKRWFAKISQSQGRPTSAFTFKALLRHYAKQTLTHSKYADWYADAKAIRVRA